MSTLKVNAIQNTSGVEKYLASAWVNFNGTGTVAIRASGNVSSITDNGTGDYTINFTTSFADANYSLSLTGGRSAIGINVGGEMTIYGGATPLTTTSARINSFRQTSGSESPNDVPFVCAAVFR